MNNVLITVLLEKTRSSLIQCLSFITFVLFLSTLTMRGINQQNG
jgi:hypothetical protein